jgi:hypothetical protein
MGIKIKGLDIVTKNLRTAGFLSGAGLETGLKRSGLLIQRASMREVPVDKGNLRGSAFTRKIGGAGAHSVIAVGYTAKYALFVHENLQATHGKAFNAKHADDLANATTAKQKIRYARRGARQKAKFLEDPLKRLTGIGSKTEDIIAAAIKMAMGKTA